MSCTTASQRHPALNDFISFFHIQLGFLKNLLNDRSYIIAICTEKASDITQHPFLEGKKKDKDGDEYFSNIIKYLNMKAPCLTEKF